jgi:hypothetical protein
MPNRLLFRNKTSQIIHQQEQEIAQGYEDAAQEIQEDKYFQEQKAQEQAQLQAQLKRDEALLLIKQVLLEEKVNTIKQEFKLNYRHIKFSIIRNVFREYQIKWQNWDGRRRTARPYIAEIAEIITQRAQERFAKREEQKRLVEQQEQERIAEQQEQERLAEQQEQERIAEQQKQERLAEQQEQERKLQVEQEEIFESRCGKPLTKRVIKRLYNDHTPKARNTAEGIRPPSRATRKHHFLKSESYSAVQEREEGYEDAEQQIQDDLKEQHDSYSHFSCIY